MGSTVLRIGGTFSAGGDLSPYSSTVYSMYILPCGVGEVVVLVKRCTVTGMYGHPFRI